MPDKCICHSKKQLCSGCKSEFLKERQAGLDNLYKWIKNDLLKKQIIERQMNLWERLLTDPY